MGEIITFYSYKGGTGRTMAMANVAWILAVAGHRVLMVDWDLEAPGLHRYFYPFLRDKELLTSTGIMDIVLDFTVQAMTPPSNDEEKAKTWYLPYADVLRHAVSIDWDFGKGQLDLLPAGRQNASYATRVNSFNWDNFYERLGGGTFLEALRASMLREYAYVLIDSRTGVSDTSGICTVQMPDKIVVCFTLNRQSIEGAASVAHSIVEARKAAGRSETQVFPVPTRVEKAETLRLDAARAASRARFAALLSHLPEETRLSYWDESEVAYQPFYAYEEMLAAFGDASPKVGSLLHTMQRLAARLVGVPEIAWHAPAPEKRAEVLAQYGWTTPVAAPKVDSVQQVAVERALEGATTKVPTKTPEHELTKSPKPVEYSFYVSYARVDAEGAGGEHLERFVVDLGRQVRQMSGEDAWPFFDERSYTHADAFHAATEDALASCRAAVCLVSPAYIHSQYCGQEFAALQQQDVPIVAVTWRPVSEPLPRAVRERIVAAPRNMSPTLERSGLQALLRLGRYKDVYHEFIVALAKQIAFIHGPARRGPVRLNETPNAFKDERAQPLIGTQVLVACVAPTTALATDLAGVLDLRVERVGPSEWDWRPFGTVRIDALIQRAALEEEVAIETTSPTASFIEQLGDRMGLILVASAILGWTGVAELLHAVNDWTGAMVSVIAVDADRESSALEEATKLWLPSWTSRGLPRADNEEELVAVIRQELVKLRSRAILATTAARPSAPEALPRQKPT